MHSTFIAPWIFTHRGENIQDTMKSERRDTRVRVFQAEGGRVNALLSWMVKGLLSGMQAVSVGSNAKF